MELNREICASRRKLSTSCWTIALNVGDVVCIVLFDFHFNFHFNFLFNFRNFYDTIKSDKFTKKNRIHGYGMQIICRKDK